MIVNLDGSARFGGVYNVLFFLHLLTAIFAIGPLAHASTTASRGVRHGDPVAAAASARMIRIYSYVSLAVVVFGFGLMSMKDPDHPGQTVGAFSDTWIWLSVLLWVVAVALALGVVVPALEKVTAGPGESSETGKVAATGGIIGVLFAVIVALMVFKP